MKNGAAYFALATGAKIIPVAIKGTFRPFTKVTFKYCKPLDFSHLRDKKREKETLDSISNEIMQTIQKELTNM